MKALIRPFIYIVSALMALSFASCNDFLDKEPEGKVPEEKVDYTNISNMYLNPEKPDVPLNKNDAFQKVQKRRVQEKR
nr:hypothetical protein [Bacteroides uniformis]